VTTNVDADGYPFVDLALARRLERTEMIACSNLVDAAARLAPERGSCWIEAAGARAMFDGPGSPMTQTFGLGMFDPVTPAHFDAIEAFFRQRGAPIFHEVSPLADAGLIQSLNDRAYRPFEFTSLMFRPIGGDVAPPDPAINVRPIGPDEEERWARVAAAGWSDYAGLDSFMQEFGRISASSRGSRSYFAEIDGEPIATATLRLHDGVAFLAGASTTPGARRRGAQLALLNRRLRDAVEAGCDLAMMGALPGSGSQRNAERHGFRIAYTRIKWRKQ
jgi:acetyltransferase (GNAT) family protein